MRCGEGLLCLQALASFPVTLLELQIFYTALTQVQVSYILPCNRCVLLLFFQQSLEDASE